MRGQLGRLGQTLTATLDLDRILEVILDTAMVTAGAEAGVIMLVDVDDADQLRERAGEGYLGIDRAREHPHRRGDHRRDRRRRRPRPRPDRRRPLRGPPPRRLTEPDAHTIVAVPFSGRQPVEYEWSSGRQSPDHERGSVHPVDQVRTSGQAVEHDRSRQGDGEYGGAPRTEAGRPRRARPLQPDRRGRVRTGRRRHPADLRRAGRRRGRERAPPPPRRAAEPHRPAHRPVELPVHADLPAPRGRTVPPLPAALRAPRDRPRPLQGRQRHLRPPRRRPGPRRARPPHHRRRSAKSTSPSATAARSSWCCCPRPTRAAPRSSPSGSAEPSTPSKFKVNDASGGRELRITVSIGIAVLGEHAETATGILAAADEALYAAKAGGRDTWRVAAA